MEHLRGCLLGDRVTVQSHLSEKRPVMRSGVCHSRTDLLLSQVYFIFFFSLAQVSAAGGAVHCCVFRPLGVDRLAAGEGGACG